MCFNIFLLPVISTRYLLAAVFMFNKWMFNIEKKDKEIPKTIEYGLKWMKIQKERNIPPKRSSKLLMTLDWYKYNIKIACNIIKKEIFQKMQLANYINLKQYMCWNK